MATVTGVIAHYVDNDYLVEQLDYIPGPAGISFSASADASLEALGTVYAGTVLWQDCGTWATWPRSKWVPGLLSEIDLTSSAVGERKPGGTASADISLTASSTGNVTYDPSISTNVAITSSTTGNCTFSSSASSDLTFTVEAEGGKLLHGVASGDLTITVSAVGERKPGGTASANINLTSTTAGVVVRDGSATADLQITASGTGSLTFLGTAIAPISLTTTLVGGLVQKPGETNTVYTVESETRVYPVLLDQVNDTAGQHLGHSYYKLPIECCGNRIYKVLFDTRTATVPSETRVQPTEVY